MTDINGERQEIGTNILVNVRRQLYWVSGMERQGGARIHVVVTPEQAARIQELAIEDKADSISAW
jgi:hypothetical protein